MEKVISQPGKRPKKNKRVVGKKRIKIKIKLLGTQKFCTRNVVKSDEYGHKINMGRAKVKNNIYISDNYQYLFLYKDCI